jgi:hypothetical protein
VVEWKWFEWHNMSRDPRRIWIDCKIGRWWYVFQWYRSVPGAWPSLYRSLDATPPTKQNKGRVFFGRRMIE